MAGFDLLSNDAARRSRWPKIAGAVPKNPHKDQLSQYGSTVDVTYDSMGDPDRCEWPFLSPASLFEEFAGGPLRWSVGLVLRMIHDSRDMSQAP